MRKSYVGYLIILIILLISMLDLPYSYYRVARVVVSAISFSFLLEYQKRGVLETLFSISVFILWNPVFPVHLAKEDWIYLDVSFSIGCILILGNDLRSQARSKATEEPKARVKPKNESSSVYLSLMQSQEQQAKKMRKVEPLGNDNHKEECVSRDESSMPNSIQKKINNGLLQHLKELRNRIQRIDDHINENQIEKAIQNEYGEKFNEFRSMLADTEDRIMNDEILPENLEMKFSRVERLCTKIERVLSLHENE